MKKYENIKAFELELLLNAEKMKIELLKRIANSLETIAAKKEVEKDKNDFLNFNDSNN